MAMVTGIVITPTPVTFSLEEARRVLSFWQRQLRLQHWDLELTIVRRAALTSATSLAETRICSNYQRGRMRLLDPVDYTENEWPIDLDMERSIVHELLHLHFDDCRVKPTDAAGIDTPEWTALERGIEAIAMTLVEVNRRSHG